MYILLLRITPEKEKIIGFFSVDFDIIISKIKISKNFTICRTVISPVPLYECEIWSFTFREEYRLRLFENR
jgi:hypothetical protein